MARLAGLILVSLLAGSAARAQPAAAPPIPTGAPPTPVPDPLTAEPTEPAPEPPQDKPAKPAKKKKEQKQKKPRVRVSGYLQTFYRQRFDTNGDGVRGANLFRVLRARIKLRGRIAPRVRFNLEVDPRAPEITGVMRDAYISFAVIPHHRIRIGQHKTPFGHDNRESSSRLYFVNRAEVSDNVARGPNLRDIGIGVDGGWPITDRLALEDAISVVNGAGMNVQADNTKRKSVYARVGVRFTDAGLGNLDVRLGASGAIGDQEEPADPTITPPEEAFIFKFKRLGVDVVVDHRHGFFAAELVTGFNEVVVGSDPDAIEDQLGYYVLAGAKTPWDVGPIARLDVLDDYQRITLGAYWGVPTARLRALINYEIAKDDVVESDHRLYFWVQARF